MSFSDIAPYLTDPLVLIGFFVFLGFGFVRLLVVQGIIPTLKEKAGHDVLKSILRYGFILGLVLMILGFGLKYLESARRHHRTDAYQQFLQSINRGNDPALSELLRVGAQARHSATDGQIAALEFHLKNVADGADFDQSFWHLKDDLDLLRLHGSDRVRRYAQDILAVMAGDYHAVDLAYYPEAVRAHMEIWLDPTTHEPNVGFDPKITREDRIRFIWMADMLDNLIDAMHAEM